MKRWPYLLWLALLCTSCASDELPPPSTGKERWIAYYGNTLPADAFLNYDLVLFDRRYHPPLSPLLKQPGKRHVLAYVSLGEIHGSRRSEINKLQKDKAIFKTNAQWQAAVIDLTSTTWHNIILAEVADAERQGFHGVMLDTLDSALHAAAEQSPDKAEANREAAIALVRTIRQRHPNLKIMLNRGFSVLPEVAPELDFILAESILSETNVSTGQSRLFPPMTYRELTGVLRAAHREAPTLKIYTLDYWPPEDVAGIKSLYAIHRAHGFIPYVTTPDLRTVTPEPHSRHAKLRARDIPLPAALVRGEHDA